MSVELPAELQGFPLAPPPPGIVPNFEHPESDVYKIFVVAGLGLGLITIATAFRVYARWMRVVKSGSIWTEVLFISGVVLSTIYIALVLACSVHGYYGRHVWDVKLGQITRDKLMFTFITKILYPLCVCLVKLALLAMFLEIFNRVTWLRYSAYAGMILITGFHIAVAIAYGVMCGPRPRNGYTAMDFLAGDMAKSCRSQLALSTIQGAVNVVSDLFLLLLPLPAVWALQMPLKTKIGVSAMFLTGSCALLASVLGLYYRIKLEQTNADTLWTVVPAWSASIGELTAGIVIFCMPAITVSLKKAKTRLSQFHSLRSQDSGRQPMAETTPNRSTGPHGTETSESHLTGGQRATFLIAGGSQASSLDEEKQVGIKKKTVFEVMVQV